MIPRSEIAGMVLAVAGALGGLAYLYHRASDPPHPMDRDELSRIARQLASDARESAKLATLVGAGAVNFNYARAQHRTSMPASRARSRAWPADWGRT